MQNMFIIHDNKDFARGFLAPFAMLREILRSFCGKGASGPDTRFDGQVQPGREAVGAGGSFIWVDSLAG